MNGLWLLVSDRMQSVRMRLAEYVFRSPLWIDSSNNFEKEKIVAARQRACLARYIWKPASSIGRTAE